MSSRKSNDHKALCEFGVELTRFAASIPLRWIHVFRYIAFQIYSAQAAGSKVATIRFVLAPRTIARSPLHTDLCYRGPENVLPNGSVQSRCLAVAAETDCANRETSLGDANRVRGSADTDHLTGGAVAAILNHMVNSRTQQLDETFFALSDPSRRMMLARLAGGDMTVAELSEPFEVSAPAISKHLKVLERAGLLSREREGRVRRCHLMAEPLKDALEWMQKYRIFWEAQLDQLADYLEKPTAIETPRSRGKKKK
ncbi:MAG: DNA-binding transcriptional ArsR family regulator [Pirellulaceae bacterium]